MSEGHNNLITGFEDLTSQSQNQWFGGASQNRIIAINGLLPHHDVGTVFNYDHIKAASTAIGISDGTTHVVTTTWLPRPESFDIPTKHTDGTQREELEVEAELFTAMEKAAVEVREGILSARRAALESVSARLDLSDAKVHKSKIEQSKEAELKAAELEAASERIEELEEDVKTANEAFVEALSTALRAVDRSGTIVVRWDSQDNRGIVGQITGFFSVNARSRSQSSGFAILSGIRQSSLVVGPDLLDVIGGSSRRRRSWWHSFVPWLSNAPHPDARVTTHIVQCQDILYLQDSVLGKDLEVRLNAAYDRFRDPGNAFVESDRIAIEATLSSLSSLSNAGRMGNATVEYTPLSWAAGSEGVRRTEQGALRSHGWQTVYAVDSALEDIEDLVRLRQPE